MADNITAAARPANISTLYKRDLPDSQDSYVSNASAAFAAPALMSSSSNISTSTAADTDFTSSTSSHAPLTQPRPAEKIAPASPTQARAQQHVQAFAPRIDTTLAQRTGDTAASPMSLESPGLTQGSKRTASGVIKTAGSTEESPTAPTFAHKRNKSTGSNTRIGEVRSF
jgi:hypothetical protein